LKKRVKTSFIGFAPGRNYVLHQNDDSKIIFIRHIKTTYYHMILQARSFPQNFVLQFIDRHFS